MVVPRKVFFNAWFWLSVLIVFLDQLSKYWAVHALADGHVVRCLPVLSLQLAFNPGAGFSLLGDGHFWQVYGLMGLSVLASLILLVWLLRTPSYDRLYSVALACLLGGAVGNGIDRVFWHVVVDFISVHYRSWYFPTFNVADMAVTLGAILFVWMVLFSSSRRP
jgi:signal peptidase II